MKAVRIQRFGGPEQVALEDVPVPVAGAGEIQSMFGPRESPLGTR